MNKFPASLRSDFSDCCFARIKCHFASESVPISSEYSISDEIYLPAAPIPDVTPSPDRNDFLHQVADEVEQAAVEVGTILK
jgi:hypothetical protein